jgi:hypothetical protein
MAYCICGEFQKIIHHKFYDPINPIRHITCQLGKQSIIGLSAAAALHRRRGLGCSVLGPPTGRNGPEKNQPQLRLPTTADVLLPQLRPRSRPRSHAHFYSHCARHVSVWWSAWRIVMAGSRMPVSAHVVFKFKLGPVHLLFAAA